MSTDDIKPRLAPGSRDELDSARRDAALVRGILARDVKSFESLIAEYDAFVRYTIFHGYKSHCHRDPTFLDARASEVWTGFAESLRRSGKGPDGTLKAYLARIARNKCADHLRRAGRSAEAASLDAADMLDQPDPATADADPLAAMLAFEQIEKVRAVIAQLPEDDRKLIQHLDLISAARWSEAAELLCIPESTLRSRWQRLMQRLQKEILL